MSSRDSLAYRLSPDALLDLEEIWRFSAETWGVDRADAYIDELTKVFETIAGFPAIASERTYFRQVVRIHVHRSHLIVYLTFQNEVDFVRILGARQDWLAILQAADS